MHEVAINEMKVLIALKIGQSRDYMTKQASDPAEALQNMTSAELLQNQISDLSFAVRILEDDAEEKGKGGRVQGSGSSGSVSLCLLSSVFCLLSLCALCAFARTPYVPLQGPKSAPAPVHTRETGPSSFCNGLLSFCNGIQKQRLGQFRPSQERNYRK